MFTCLILLMHFPMLPSLQRVLCWCVRVRMLVHFSLARSGSCPSQLLQSLPMDGCHIAATGNETSVGQTVLRAHHRLFGGSSGGGSARIKHKERSNIVVANFAHRWVKDINLKLYIYLTDYFWVDVGVCM